MPHLFLFHVPRIKECNPAETGSLTNNLRKRKYGRNRYFAVCEDASDAGRTSRTPRHKIKMVVGRIAKSADQVERNLKRLKSKTWRILILSGVDADRVHGL